MVTGGFTSLPAPAKSVASEIQRGGFLLLTLDLVKVHRKANASRATVALRV